MADCDPLLSLDVETQSAKQMAIVVGEHLGIDAKALKPAEVLAAAKDALNAAASGGNPADTAASSPVKKPGGGAVKAQLKVVAAKLHALSAAKKLEGKGMGGKPITASRSDKSVEAAPKVTATEGSTEESEEYHEVLHPGHFGLSQHASSHHIGLTFDATATVPPPLPPSALP